MYVSDRRKEREWEDDGDKDTAYESKTVERGYYNAPESSAIVVRERDPYRYAGYEVAVSASISCVIMLGS